jgi:flagellar motor switch protein FliM
LKQQLSQQEIDSYFDAADVTRPPSDVAAVPFDFRRLDRIPKSLVGSIHTLHEVFVKSLCSNLTVYLRSFVSGSVTSVEQMPYTDFAEALPASTCLLYLTLDPYEGYAIVEASPPLVASVLELVLGGSGKVETELNREITEVEKPLLEGFLHIVTQNLRETWKPVVAVSFATNAIETRTQSSGRFVPTEAVVAVAMELRIGDRGGMLNLAIPSIALKTMGQRFDQQWTNRRSENPATELAIRRKLARDLQVTLGCQYSGDSIGLRDLLGLSVGDVVILPGFDETVDVLVNGTAKFRGALRVSQNNRRAVAIQHRCADISQTAMRA